MIASRDYFWKNEKAGIEVIFSNSKAHGFFLQNQVTHSELINIFPQLKEVTNYQQVHGVEIQKIKQLGLASTPCDGALTQLAFVGLTVHTADCIPILFSDGKSIASCHAGWRGLAAGIIDQVMTILKASGCNFAKLEVAIGPHIRSCHFEVENEVASKFFLECAKSHVDPKKKFVDLSLHLQIQLRKYGVKPKSILDTNVCSYCDSHYWSYRRDKKTGLRNESIIFLESQAL